MEEYKLLIEYLPVDAYIYLYKERFREPDEEILKYLKEKTGKLFIARSSADCDLKDIVENNEGVNIQEDSEIDDKDIEEYLKKYSSELKRQYEKEINTINKCLGTEGTSVPIYHISGKKEYKNLFDYNKLIENLIKTIPNHKLRVLLHAFKKNTAISFYLKHEMIKEIIKAWSIESAKLFTDESFQSIIGFMLEKAKEITNMYGIEVDVSGIVSNNNSDSNIIMSTSDKINESGSIAEALYRMPTISKADTKRAEKYKEFVLMFHETLTKVNDTCLAKVAIDVLTIESN
jgi:hypothetical protein